ncbi:MAG TPA: hypothetical protein EYH17_02720 [Pyrodictium sp.]|nr:hypothetical protein [Pyrodictium sp.]
MFIFWREGVSMPTLIVMRHGKAVSKDVAGSDEDRWLTEEGKKDVRLAAQCIPFRPAKVLSSPLRRARETATIVVEVLGLESYEVVEELKPGKFTLDALARLSPGDKTVVIAHAPDVNHVIAALIGGGSLEIPAGGFALVEYEKLEPGKGILKALIAPKLVGKIVEKR